MHVSILIPCYNAERWIGAAIESALAQTWPDKEVIVVDDGSTDGSLEVIRSFGDKIRWETGPNLGGNVARNRLLELASGEWLQYLDADDYLLPNHIESQVRVAETNPAAAVIYSPVIMEYWPTEHSQQAGSAQVRREVLSIPEPYDPWILLIRWYLPQTGAALWRRQAVREVGAWRVDQPCCQEHELYLRLLAAGQRFEFNPSSGAVYRQWSTDTVCRKNPLETFRRRLAVVDAAEQHLSRTGALCEVHQRAIALTRLECARSVFQLDRRMATAVAARAQAAGILRLTVEPAFPLAYRAAYRLFGFGMAEQIAATARRFRYLVGTHTRLSL